MAFPLIFIGLLLIMVAARDKTEEFQELVKSDFFGQGGTPFIGWILAVLALTALGNIKPLRGVTDGFLTLIAVVLLLANRGFFEKFQEQALGKNPAM